MKSLINKTLMQFVGCTVIVLLLLTPVFYLLTKHFYAEDMIDLIEAVERGQAIPEMDLERDILKGVMIQFFLIFSVLSCSMFITLRIITRKLWRPFDDTLNKMEQFNLERNEEPVFLATDIKEFHRLNESVSLLIKRNRKSYRTQKEFTENASHELQTPLAITQSKLDLLLQEELNERQSEIVGDLYKTCTRMSRLNKNLLLLARIENAQYADMKQIELCAFIQNLLPMFDNLRGFDSSITFIKPQEPVYVKANDGPLDRNLLFRRFQFTDDKKRGNGLGLSIVKAISDFHGWVINYNFEEGKHCFTVCMFKV